MATVAAILDFAVLYRYSLILAFACGAGICFFMGCCCHAGLPGIRASAAALTAMLLSLPLARLIYWYGRPDSFSSVYQALTASNAEALALSGVFAGCGMSAVLVGGRKYKTMLLDCMSLAGCGAIALGRLGTFFTEASRGQIMKHLQELPWAYPVVNASGQLEYRFATFLFQSAAAAVLGVFLAVIFFRKKRPGDVTVLFLLFYSASQMLLDSTRYDALLLRSNGFVHLVQLLCGAALVCVLLLLCIRTANVLGLRIWMIPIWILLAGLLAGTGYMEYYVQRHGQQAFGAYSLMALLLVSITALGLFLMRLSRPSEPGSSSPVPHSSFITKNDLPE